MTALTRGAVLVATLALLRDHSDILVDEAQRLAQAHGLEKLGALIEAAAPEATGQIALRGEATVQVFSLLADCVARLRRAAEDTPSLERARARLARWQDTVEQIRDAAITATIRTRPAHRQDPRRRNGHRWNPPDPRG